MRSLPFLLLLIAACGPSAKPTKSGPPAPKNPAVVNEALLREIASGTRPLEAFIDPSQGLVHLDTNEHPGDDDQPSPPIERRLCGAELTAELPKFQGWITEGVKSTDENGELRCWEQTCGFGATMEWDPAIDLIFRIDPERGAMLTAITSYDYVLVGDEAIAETHQQQRQKIAELTAKPCP